MKLVDVHCHLESVEFEGILDGIIADSAAAGIVKLITSSITPSGWPLSESIAARYPLVAFTLGVHPWYCTPEDHEAIPLLAGAARRGAVAIGEIGLDRKTSLRDMDIQMSIFEEQLKIARDINLPVMVHCRGAFDDLRSAVRRIGMPVSGGVLHNFSGSAEIAAEFIRYGFSFSFGGVLTYRNSTRKEKVLKRVYPDHMLLETDSPDIPPVEAPSKTNVPSNIRHVLRAAAEMLGVSEEIIAEKTTGNAERIFRLSV